MDEKKPANDHPLTLGEHLHELRRRLIRCVLILIIAVGVCFYFQDFLMGIALKPHLWATENANKIIAETRMAELMRGNPYERAAAALKAPARNPEARIRIGEYLASLENAGFASEIEKDLASFDCADAALGEKFSVPDYIEAGRAAAAVRFKAFNAALPESDGKSALLAYVDGRTGNAGALAEILRASDEERSIRELAATPQKLMNLKYTEAFMAYFLLALIASFVLAFPFISWQIWGFISVGLYRRERMIVYKFVPFSVLLFAAGVLFGYFILIPTALGFLASYGNQDVMQNSFTLGFYLSLIAMLTLITGLIFETPLVMYIIARIGLVSAKGFASFRKYFIVIAFVIAAVVTPTPDAVTQLCLAIPLILLYEFGILLARFGSAKKPADAEAVK
jgi:sec-independent protein translocase protein TatC